MKMSLSTAQMCFVLVWLTVSIESFGHSELLHPSDYVDPGDMLHYDPTTKTMTRDIVPPKGQPTPEIPSSKDDDTSVGPWRNDHHTDPKESSHCQQSEFHFYKRFIRSLLVHFTSELYMSSEMEDMKFDVLMELTESELATLKSYVSPTGKVAVQDVDEILIRLVKRVRLHQVATMYEGGVTWLERLLEQAKDNIGVIVAVLSGFFAIFLFRQMSPARAFVLGLVLLFIAGTVYEGIHMFQKLEAEKFAERHKLGTVPEHCNPESVNVFRRLSWSLQVNLLGMDDPCKKYYELLLVDTRYQINPLEVATSALGKVFETMARFGGNAFGLFYSKALAHFNFFERLIFAAVITIVIIVAVMYMGPAFVFLLPGLIRGARRAANRDMVEDIPPGQYKSSGALMQRSPPTIAPALCSNCGSHQVTALRDERCSTPGKITITAGNKCISIEDVEETATESSSTQLDTSAASKENKHSKDETLPLASYESTTNST